MSAFSDSLDEDFENILAGDFSRRVVITSKATPTNTSDTFGIFDESDETVAGADGAYVTAKLPRITLWYKNFPFTIVRNDSVKVYNTDGTLFYDYRVKDVDDPSEGQVLLWLRRTNE